jgi:hypothetical protein
MDTPEHGAVALPKLFDRTGGVTAMSDPSRLDALLDRWEALGEQGEDVAADELCRDCPELFQPLRRRIDALRAMRWMAPPDGVNDPELATEHAPGFFPVPPSAEPPAAITIEGFVTAVAASGLLSAADIDEFQAQLAPDEPHGDARLLARLLVERGKLTDYQAACLLEGKKTPLVVDRYVILDALDAGGMGVVFRARHRSMDRIVALKVLPAAVVASPDDVRRFRREARAVAALDHPNIVTAYDADEFLGMHFLVMEYVPGRNLARVVREDGPPPVSRAVEWITHAARGLEHAHAQGIIHRDIKPANLVLTESGTIKLLDLGLARFVAPTRRSASQSLTHDSLTMGTVPYLSPEQAMNAKHADARSDIYSLGCTLHYLLTGSAPYSGNTTQMLMAHQNVAIPSLQHVRSDIPAALDVIFRRMVAKLPAKRYQSVSELLADLESLARVLARGGEGAAPAPKPTPAPAATALDPAGLGAKIVDVRSGTIDIGVAPLVDRARPVKRPRRSWLAGAVVVPTLAILASAGVFYSLHRRSADPPGTAPARGLAQVVAPKARDKSARPAPASTDPDRALAEWVLGQPGMLELTVLRGEDRFAVSRAEDLPKGGFAVATVILKGAGKMTDADLTRFGKVASLQRLVLLSDDFHIPAVTDRGLNALFSPPTGRGLWYFELWTDLPGVTDDGYLAFNKAPDLRTLYLQLPAGRGSFLPRLVLPRLDHLGVIGERLPRELFDGLPKRMPELRIFHVQGARPGPADVQVLASLPLLKIVRLVNCGLVDSHLEVLGKLARLTELRLDNNSGVDDRGAADLANLAALEVAGLDETSAGDGACKALAALPALADLSLRKTRVGDAGLEALASLRTLKRLDIRGCSRVTDAALDALSRNTSLTDLNIAENPQISAAAVGKLRLALPQCKINAD